MSTAVLYIDYILSISIHTSACNEETDGINLFQLLCRIYLYFHLVSS